MAVAPRAQPEDFFSTEEWQALTARSSWRGLWVVAHCWAVIGAAMVAHRLLERRGVTARMETQPGYASLLTLAAAA
ncbi:MULTISPECIES: hypothetical protein [unclassified Variovorax]|uniref:hypothetical protein n=1 Tax=unclassified Variovorax TaxID=663243 RepID=UPI0008870602|nr:hypothetical protein [Variovorax sp. CF079]SDC28891.1 hypothetical protein SAMN05444679_102162 [Variovorax sp. CF079]